MIIILVFMMELKNIVQTVNNVFFHLKSEVYLGLSGGGEYHSKNLLPGGKHLFTNVRLRTWSMPFFNNLRAFASKLASRFARLYGSTTYHNRIYSNTRRGAYYIFPLLSAALIRGGLI